MRGDLNDNDNLNLNENENLTYGNLCYGQAEEFHLVITRIKAGQHGIIIIYPSFHIVFDIEVHHA